jgi:hypothetical protein
MIRSRDLRFRSFKAVAKPTERTIIRKKFSNQELFEGPIPSCLRSTALDIKFRRITPITKNTRVSR